MLIEVGEEPGLVQIREQCHRGGEATDEGRQQRQREMPIHLSRRPTTPGSDSGKAL